MQAKTNGDELAAIETYGGVISFNLEECWYAGTLVITPFRRPVVPPPSISRTAGTLTTHTVQALLIRSQAALIRLQAACIRLQAVLIRCRYLDSQFCAPLHVLRGSMDAGVADVMMRARANRKSRKSGAILRLLCRHAAIILTALTYYGCSA